MSKRCVVYLRLGLKALMGNERLNETLSMFSIIVKNKSDYICFECSWLFGLPVAVISGVKYLYLFLLTSTSPLIHLFVLWL